MRRIIGSPRGGRGGRGSNALTTFDKQTSTSPSGRVTGADESPDFDALSERWQRAGHIPLPPLTTEQSCRKHCRHEKLSRLRRPVQYRGRFYSLIGSFLTNSALRSFPVPASFLSSLLKNDKLFTISFLSYNCCTG